MTLRFLVGNKTLASPKAVSLLHEILRRTHDRGGRERPEIHGPVIPDDPAGGEHREVEGCVGAQCEIALVVPHQDVEVRLVFLYEGRLGEQGLGLVLHRHELEVRDGIDH